MAIHRDAKFTLSLVRFWLPLAFTWQSPLCAAESRPVFEPQGAPWVRHTIDNTGKGSDGTKLADVNGDGRIDLVTGWEEGGRARGKVRFSSLAGPRR